jgi:hypothetical protein
MTTAIFNRGSGTLSGLTVGDYSGESFSAWLRHELHGNTLTFTIDRNALPAADGFYQARVPVLSDNGGLDYASIGVNKGAGPANAGVVYVLLASISGGEDYQVIINAGSAYAFSFTSVKAGQYILAAGTDLDNDKYIDSPGELFGLYPNMNTYQIITVTANQNLANFNFPLEFQ